MLEVNKEVTTEALTAASSHNPTGLFMVFAYSTYYPAGGFGDFIGLALSLDQARGMVADQGISLGGYQVVNYKSMDVVESGNIGWEN